MKRLSTISQSVLYTLLAAITAIILTACFSLNSQAYEGSEGKEYISVCLSSGEEVVIYAGANYLNGKYTDDIGYVEGITYDFGTNTLTLNNFVDVNATIGANYVGEDFKVEVAGECHFMYIIVYQGCLELCGDGVLVLNEVMNEGNIIVSSPYEHTGLKIGENLTLLLYEESEWLNGTFTTGFYVDVPAGVTPVEIGGTPTSDLQVSAQWFDSSYRYDYEYDYADGTGTAEVYYEENLLKGYQLVSSGDYCCENGFVDSGDKDVTYRYYSTGKIIHILPAGA